jgi:haloacetate dehalogenase
MGFQSVPDIPPMLMAGREDLYMGYVFQNYAYDPNAVSPERMRHYVEAMRQAGALYAGLGYDRDYFVSAAQNELHAKT